MIGIQMDMHAQRIFSLNKCMATLLSEGPTTTCYLFVAKFHKWPAVVFVRLSKHNWSSKSISCAVMLCALRRQHFDIMFV